MPRKAFTALVALLPAILPNPALALSLGLSAGIGASAASSPFGAGLDLDLQTPVQTAGSATMITARAASQPSTTSANVGHVIDLIQSSAWTQASLSGSGRLALRAIRVSDAGSAFSRATLDAALGVYAAEIGELHRALATNPAVSAWLTTNAIPLESIVAASLGADGTLSVFTD